ncbi:uncharacterized protein Z520_11661 [Fonsecaea multimorphosa CBS 102226]|uniref:SMP-30/Gluconolactonase/LRE-like region domain-containing protein n=1 Tax=Fonsecaea multimorphosa CBS 102226 TaxID=1442371 RepID=A0A0D2JHG2_9EURO|nr:uncharacterized protein Z520_11661 [Fonsecaea multimorphosa CBS 102226]KIX92632.1 hypothetical protein Z520_11661 [Fonsecaea multimorphosa CBS 102226]OAL17855.1 hypothetical protein AYO22_11199 [Fonsecaea multimorphosa]
MLLKMNEAQVSLVASFPPGFFLENIAGSTQTGFYITCLNRQELYWLPPCPESGRSVSPLLVATFEEGQRPMGIVNAPHNPNVRYLVTSELTGSSGGKSYLRMLDNADSAVRLRTRTIMEFPPSARVLNGLCALSESVLLAADSFASCIWRIDLDLSVLPHPTAKAEVWYSHCTMAGKLNLSDIQPGTNGLKYSAKTKYVYYTSTQQKLVCRVQVDACTFNPVGEAEVLAKGWQWDDLILDDRDDKQAVAYVTTHRDNAIVKVNLELEDDKVTDHDMKAVVQGPACSDCIGPTAGIWLDGRVGQSALFLTDGGIKRPPPDGILRCAKVIRVDFCDV